VQVCTLDPTERLSIVGFTDPLFRELLAEMPEEQRLASMHIVDTRGRVHSAGRAVMLLLSLTGTRKQRFQMRLARLFPPLRNKIEREYQRLASRRGELSERVDDVPPVSRPPGWYRPV
jgi:predicted DCC family thiol-disulfide oxidoreductase YuxK